VNVVVCECDIGCRDDVVLEVESNLRKNRYSR